VHVEPARPNELPEGIPAPETAPAGAKPYAPGSVIAGHPYALPAPAPAPAAPEPSKRRGPGRPFTPADAAEVGRKGALAGWQYKREEAEREREAPKVLLALGLRSVPPEGLLPYLDMAQDFAQHETARLAQTVGGGTCGAGPASLVQSAALQLACSRFLFATGAPEHMTTAARLANDSRQNLLCAHELVAREARARADQPGDNDIDRLRRRMAQGGEGASS
jgi:hypothetical protein